MSARDDCSPPFQPARPHEVVLSSDGGIAVVTDYSGDPGRTLTVIDVPGRRVVRTIELGEHRRPHGIVFLPGDSVVAVTSEQSGHVVLVHVGDGTVRRAIPTTQKGSHMVAVTADARHAYTGNMGATRCRNSTCGPGLFARGTFTTPEAINVTPMAPRSGSAATPPARSPWCVLPAARS
jgi:DNA-binding beta-propeller fold protein YncE